MNELKFRLALDNGAFVTGMNGAGAQLDRFGGQSDRAAAAAERLSANVARVGHYAAGLVALNQIGQTGGQLIRLADEYANMAGRLNLVSDSTAQATAAQAKLFDLAQQTRTGVAGLSDVFVKLRQSTDGTGISQERLLAITGTIGKTMTLSGSSAESMTAALMQLGQGMSAGVLRGEELNSILEQAPALAQAIATGMGTTVGALRKLGEEGKLTSEVVVNALEQSAKKVDSDFSKLPLTVGQAMTQVQNSLLQAVGVFDQANGLSSGLASGISTLAQNMGTLVSVATVLAGVMAGRMAASVYAGVTATLADRTARIASLQATVAQTEAVAIHTGFVLADARATLASASGFGASVVAQNAVVAATQRHTAALAAQGAAQAAVASTSAAATLGARALGLLGGPIGLVTTALSLGVAAWQMWGDSSKASEAAATGNVERSTGDIIASLDKQIAKLQERNRLAAAGAAGIAKGGGEGAEELGRLQKKIDDFTAGKGEATGVNDMARQAILQTTIQQYAALYSRMQQVGDEQKKLDAIGQQSKLSAYMEKYANDAEKLQAELKKVREELGGVIPPDLEARIRAKFTKPVKEGIDYAKQYADLVADLTNSGSGLAANFNEQANVLARGYALTDKSAEAATRYRQAVEALINKQPFAVAQAKAEADAREALNKAFAEGYNKLRNDAEQSAAAVAGRVQGLRDEEAAAALMKAGNLTLAAAMEEVIIKRLEDQREQARALGNNAAVAAINAEIAARRELAGLVGQKAAREAGDELRKRETAEWAKTWEQVGQSFADNLMNGGKSASQYIKDLFRTMVLRPLMQPVMGAMTASLGLPGTASASGGAGGTGGMGSMMSSLSGLAGLGSAFKAGSALTMSGAGGTGLALEGAGSMIGSGSYAAGAAQGAGALAPWAMAAMAGGAIGRGISNGYGIGGKSGNGVVNTGMVVGAIVGGPLGAAIGGAIGGVVNRAFGRKLTETGIEGTLGGDAGFSGNAYTKEKGGWFRSDRTRTSALDAGTTSAFSGAVDTLRTQTRDYAAALGLGADSVGTYTQRIKLNLMGLSEADQTKAIDGALSDFANGLAASLGAGLDRVALRGEKAGDTLARLGGALTTVNDTLGLLGQAALAASLDGGAAADALLNAFGGVGNFDSLTSSYFANFYGEAERTVTQTGQMAKALGRLGLEMPTTNAAFRALVEQQDLNTDAGRRNYAALMSLNGAFAELYPLTDKVSTAVEQVASAMEKAGATVSDEIKRIRGLTAAGGGKARTFAEAQSQFAITTAQARAGDAAAMAALPDASRALIDLADTAGRDRTAQAALQASIADSLQSTLDAAQQQPAAPAAATADAPAVPAPATPAATATPAQQTNADLLAELRALRAEVAALRAEQETNGSATATNTDRMQRLLTRIAPNDAVQVRILT